MARKCQIDESLLVDYLDGNLSGQARADLDMHIAQCACCREKIQTQRQWFNLVRQSGLEDTRERVAGAPTLARLQASIREEIKQEQQTARPLKKGWRRPLFWAQAAGLAAAVLVFALAVPMLLNLWQNTRATPSDGKIDGLDDLSIAGMTTQSTAGGLAVEGADKHVLPDGKSAWQVYKGSLADISAMSCFFQPDEQGRTTVETTSSGGETGLQPSESQKEGNGDPDTTLEDLTVANYFAAPGRELNQQGEELLDLLSEAQKLRVIVHAADPDQAMIVAGYADDSVENITERLQQTLKACQTPIRIEIIRHVDLFLWLEQLESGLFERMFTDLTETDITWISILIGA